MKRILSGLMFASLVFLLPASVQADVVEVAAEPSTDNLRIAFSWPAPVEFSSSSEGRELVIYFSRAIEISHIEDLSRLQPEWIEGASNSYDSVLLRSARDVRYSVSASANQIIVDMTASSTPTTPSASEEEKARLRLDLLRARLLGETGQLGEALESLDRLGAKQPENPSILASQANLEQRIGRWRRADALYSRALRLDSQNDEIIQAKTQLLREHAPQILFDADRKSVAGGQLEQRSRISGHGLLRGHRSIGFVYDWNSVQMARVHRDGGPTGASDGVYQRGEIYFQQDSESGAQVKGLLFSNLSTLGLGVHLARPDTRGQNRILVDYRRPYWEFIEGVVGGGVRDRLEIQREHRLTPRLNGWLTGALNRYGLDKDSSVASSIAGGGGLNYSLIATRPSIFVQYRFDGEYRGSGDVRVDAAGASYSPIPLVSREVHAGDLIIATELKRHFRAEGFAGFALDRLGGNGPFFGGRLTYDKPAHLGAQVWFDHRLNSVNTGEVINQFGFQLLWRFRY